MATSGEHYWERQTNTDAVDLIGTSPLQPESALSVRRRGPSATPSPRQHSRVQPHFRGLQYKKVAPAARRLHAAQPSQKPVVEWHRGSSLGAEKCMYKRRAVKAAASLHRPCARGKRTSGYPRERPRHVSGGPSKSSRAYRLEAPLPRWWCGASRWRTRGARASFVGPGNWIRTPSWKSTGLNSSGTVSCITGLFKYLRTCASKPWCGPAQPTLQTFLLGNIQLLKPSKCFQKRCTTPGETKLTKA
mmetsp:Transcript_173429/g.556301  ORF Transcript_173429/g.556301 Transcript_173429/m.556301 type:complete len:246 (+) Transcript_173429:285-1022(+)